jgi:hypothetical protein
VSARVALAGALALVSTTGCSLPVFQDPVTVSTKSLTMPAAEPGAPAVTGKSCSRVVLLILPVSFGTSNGAFKEALENAKTDTLVNWRLRQTVAGFIPLYYQVCLVVEGQPASAAALGPGVTAPAAAPASAAAPAP